jgi:hypothetical protein
MEWNQNEKPGNMNNLTELTKILRLSDMISEKRVRVRGTVNREDERRAAVKAA